MPLKNCLFGMANLVRNVFKSKFAYNVSDIAFDEEGTWSFSNNFARDVLTFNVDDTSSSYTDNHRNNF